MAFDVSSFLGGSFLTHLDLPLPQQTWTIGKADEQLVGTDRKICLGFAEFPAKALGLNNTNLRRVADLYGTDGSNWIGKSLLVYRSACDYQGQRKLCVRVCGPQQSPPDPLCDPQGNPVLFQPAAGRPAQQPQVPLQQPVATPQPVAAPQAAASPSTAPAPWEADAAQENNPPSA